MTRIMLIVFSVLASSACTHTYVPNEYVIAENRIKNLDINGTVEVKSVPFKDKEIRLDYGAHTWVTTTKVISDAMTAQLTKEIRKRGFSIENNAVKSLHIDVRYLTFTRGFFTLAGKIEFKVRMGDKLIKDFSIDNTSPTNIQRTLNGTIARSVMAVLNDKEIQNYLEN